MKRAIVLLLAFAGMAGISAGAQDITGIWQGTLVTPQRGLRTVIKITKDDGVLESVFSASTRAGSRLQ